MKTTLMILMNDQGMILILKRGSLRTSRHKILAQTTPTTELDLQYSTGNGVFTGEN